MAEVDETDDLVVNGNAKPPAKIRSRIMATGYRYRLLDSQYDEETELDLREQQRSRPSFSVNFWRILCLVLSLAVIVLIVGLIAVLTKQQHDVDNSKVCEAGKCVQLSAYILKKMDPTEEPCADMYRYSCGGWLDSTIPPPDRAKYNQFSQVDESNKRLIRKLIESKNVTYNGKNSTAIQKLMAYYETCMDESRIEEQGTRPMLKVMRTLGSWTVTKDGSLPVWNDTSWNFAATLMNYHKLTLDSFFAQGLVKDTKVANAYMITFVQSGLTLGDQREYSNSRADMLKEGFMAYAEKVGRLLGGDNSTRKKMEEVYELEKRLAEIMVPKEDMVDPNNVYNKMSIKDFQDLIGSWIDIKTYMKEMYRGREFTDDYIINVHTPKYFGQLGKVISETKPEVLANYLMWNMVDSFPGYLPRAFSDAALELVQVETGINDLGPRWKRCLTKADSIGYATSALFIKQKFSPHSKVKVKVALDGIKQAFIDNLDDVAWLDSETRTRLREKAAAMENMVGYPDWITDPKALDEYYENVTIVDGEFLTSKLNIINFFVERQLAKFGKSPDRKEWGMLPHEVNAYYTPQFNYVVIPAGLLQLPFYSDDYPQSMLYATIGAIVGHEITHGFDNIGRHFDKDGVMTDIWTERSAQSFQKHSKCMIDQFSSYTVQGEHLDGNFTLAENIADSGGLKFAFTAYRRAQSSETATPAGALPGLKLTSDQLFFLSFSQIWCAYYTPQYAKQTILTDEHPYAKYRVIGSMENSAHFAEAYNCEDKNEPHPKCSVW